MKHFAVIAMVMIASTASALAEVRTHAGAKISLDVPKEWQQKTDGDNFIMVEPKGDIIVALRILPATDLQKAAKELDAKVADLVFDLAWDQKPVSRKVNGLDAVTIDGGGKMKSNAIPVKVMAAIVASPAKKIVLVLVLADSRKIDAHAGELKSILGSIRPAQ